MLSGVPAGEIAVLIGAVLLGGLVTGLLAGLFGVGGGSVIVPVLYEVFRALEVPEDIRMQLCVGTSLAIIVPTTIRSYRAHLTHGLVRMDIIRAWRVPALAGVGVGLVAAAFAPPGVFKIVFSLVGFALALKLLFARDTWRLSDNLPGQPLEAVYGFLIGLASAMIGVNGGAICNTILSLYGVSLHASIGIAAGLGVPITIMGVIGYMIAGWSHMASTPPLSIGFVSLIGVAVMAPVTAYVAPYGARLAHRLSRRQLEISFGIYLLLISMRFLVGMIFGI